MRFVSFIVKKEGEGGDNSAASWGFVAERPAPIGAVSGHAQIVDLGAHFSGQANGKFPTLRSFIAAGMPDLVALGKLEPTLATDEITLLPVIPDPEKILMAALNYHEPVVEGDTAPEPPEYPVLFARLPRSQVAHGAALIRPLASQKLDYEGELAVIIGRGGRHIARERAMEHVAGYSIYNDGSVRDWQRHSHQFTPGKNFDGTGGFGPWMVTTDALPDPETGLALMVRVNGIEKQRTTTSRMIFDVPYLISYISTFTTLAPGDVIVTGTCTGFGATRKPQEFLSAGDIVEVEIEGIGTLINHVLDEVPPLSSGDR